MVSYMKYMDRVHLFEKRALRFKNDEEKTKWSFLKTIVFFVKFKNEEVIFLVLVYCFVKEGRSLLIFEDRSSHFPTAFQIRIK